MQKQVTPDERSILQCRILPRRLTLREAGEYLGYTAPEMTILVRRGIARVLGNPPSNGHKFLALVDVEAWGQSREWLAKATQCIYKYHVERNSKYALNRRNKAA